MIHKRSTKVRTLKGIFTRIKETFQSAAIFGTNPVSILALYCWHFVKNGVKEFWELADMNPTKKFVASWSLLVIAVLSIRYPNVLWLLALVPVAFIQNMFFTLVSRSRNSQDTEYHRYCAWGSNGVWFLCQIMIVKNIWSAINAGQWWYAIMAGVVYALATTEGSVLMMKRLIKSESGKRRVGANDKIDGLESRIAELERYTNHAVVHNHNPMIMGFTGPPTDDHIDLPAPTEIKIEKIEIDYDYDNLDFVEHKMTDRAKGFDDKAGDQYRKRNPDR